jgi:hypothetical protein
MGYSIDKNSLAVIMNKDDYDGLIDQKVYQLSVFMKSPADYKRVIAQAESDYLVFYPYGINLVGTDAQAVFNILSISVISIAIAVVLIILSIFVLRRSYIGKNKQNAVLLSLGYGAKQIKLSGTVETAVLLLCAIVFNAVIIIISRIMRTVFELEKSFIPLTNLRGWFVAFMCGFIAAVYLLFFMSRFRKIDKMSINQTIKQGGAVGL